MLRSLSLGTALESTQWRQGWARLLAAALGRGVDALAGLGSAAAYLDLQQRLERHPWSSLVVVTLDVGNKSLDRNASFRLCTRGRSPSRQSRSPLLAQSHTPRHGISAFKVLRWSRYLGPWHGTLQKCVRVNPATKSAVKLVPQKKHFILLLRKYK